MAISLNSIDFRIKFPEIPRSLDVIETSAPSIKERQRTIEVMAETLKLGKRRTVDLPHGTAYFSHRGEVEYFQASGAVWSRDAEAEQEHDNELRKWPELIKEGRDEDTRFALPEKTSHQLLAHAKDLIGAADLADKTMDGGRVVLDQVAQLDEKGKILQSGAGGASVIYNFTIEELPVFGAGAKSTLAFEPVDGEPKVVGGLHVWRSPGKGRQIEMPSVEEALSVGLLQDPELLRYSKKGGKITVTRLAFGYMALPAMMQQLYLFPVFDVQGKVTLEDDKLGYFLFSSYHHAASAASYKKADLYAPYLARRN
jgi:hypothetical protein